jgi:hypothetical protein
VLVRQLLIEPVLPCSWRAPPDVLLIHLSSKR